MLPSPHGNHTEEDEEQDRDEAAPCRGAGLGARDRGAAWRLGAAGRRGGSAAAESGEQQPEGVARATRQHSEAFIIFAWARPLSCVIWGKMDGRGKM